MHKSLFCWKIPKSKNKIEFAEQLSHRRGAGNFLSVESQHGPVRRLPVCELDEAVAGRQSASTSKTSDRQSKLRGLDTGSGSGVSVDIQRLEP